jgi:patatin-like phospholipase/acyl hydrolase
MSKDNKKIVVLFTYGGGLRGLIPAHIMARIESVTGMAMSDMVDVFCGPSTASILNAALTIPHPRVPDRPRFSARQMVRFYEREGHYLFPTDSTRAFRGLIHDFNNRMMKIGQLDRLLKHGHYDPARLGRALRALFGRHKLADSLSSLIIPAYNIEGNALETIQEMEETANDPAHTKNNIIDKGGYAMWFKNMRIANARNLHPVPDIELYDAVMGSTAAPTLFPCHRFTHKQAGEERSYPVSLVDGSLFDNPCISYMGAIRQHLPKDAEVVMICLGTGFTNKSVSHKDWNKYGALGVVDPSNDFPLINIFFHAPESALLGAFKDELGEDMYILNKSLLGNKDPDRLPSTAPDDSSPENIQKLRHFAYDIMSENEQDFNKICHILADNGKERLKSRKRGRLFHLFGE